MQTLSFSRESGRPRRILCLGAHADDIEIGCGGTILRLLADGTPTDVRWIVFSASPARSEEARASGEFFLAGAVRREISVLAYRDGFFPFVGAEIKDAFEEMKGTVSPDIIFTHHRDDRHQDHRVISDLTWNTFRNHLILEYEIPKYDGDLGAPNFFVPLSDKICRTKVDSIVRLFPSQGEKHWFGSDTLFALARLRGMESGGAERHAEGFYCRKIVI